MEPEDRLLIRGVSRWQRILIGGWIALTGAVCVQMMALAADDGIAWVVLFAIAFVGVETFYVRMYRCAVEARGNRLIIRNIFRTHRLALKDVERFQVRAVPLAPTSHLEIIEAVAPAGRRYAIFATVGETSRARKRALMASRLGDLQGLLTR